MLLPSGDTLKHAPRPGSRNGGAVILVRHITSSPCTTADYTNSEYIDYYLSTDDTTMRLAIGYRSPSSKKNALTIPEFFDHCSTFLLAKLPTTMKV